MNGAFSRFPPLLRCFFVLLCGAVLASGQTTPPARFFDLNQWKLHLPVNAEGKPEGKSIEIRPQPDGDLNTTYASPYFYARPDGGMVFYCPLNAATTNPGKTKNPRSELREVPGFPQDTSPEGNCWPWNASTTLEATLQVNVPPSGTEKVVVGQIHAEAPGAPPLIKLQFEPGKKEGYRLRAMVKILASGGEDVSFVTPDGFAKNTNFSYKIEVNGGKLSVWVDGRPLYLRNKDGLPDAKNPSLDYDFVAADPGWKDAFYYFKAGVYPQSDSTADPAYAQATFYALKVSP